MKKNNEISRRNLLQRAGTVAAAGAFGVSDTWAASQASTTQSGKTNGMPRTLVLMCDRYHNQDYIRVSLNRLFKELNLPVDYTTNYYDLSKSLLEPYQLFICFRDDMIWPGGYSSGPAEEGARQPQDGLENPGEFPPEKAEYWITEAQGQAVKDFVSAGNGFYSLHNNAFVSRSSKNYRDVQGGVALGHPPIRPFKVRIANKEHPVTQGVEDFMVTDEQHYAVYDKDPKNILLHGENLDGFTFETGSRQGAGRGRGTAAPENQGLSGSEAPQDHGTTSISGWAHEYGQGRVVFTSMGHTTDVMWHPEYFKIQKNAVRWLLKKV
jgi:type 1 glutamine amidotransferase